MHGTHRLDSLSAPRLALQARCARVTCSGGGRGFGQGSQQTTTQQDVQVEGGGRRVKIQRSKGKQSMRLGPGRQGPQPPPPQLMVAPPGGEGGGAESLVDQLEFEARLKALKAAADEKKAGVRAAAAASGNVLDGPRYDDPPPLAATLFGGGQTTSAAEADAGTFGPSQVGLAVASLALVVVFLATSGGGPPPPAATPAPAAVQPAPELRRELEAQLAAAAAQLEADPSNLDALERSAVLHARLGDYAAAKAQLAALTAARPGDADAWRVLAEARGALGDAAGGVAAYRRAWQAGGQSSVEVLNGLASALAADGKAKEAVDEVRQVAASPEASQRLGDVEVGLLLGKAYSQWRGHVADALTQYDALAAAHPDDFRPPLAKGLLLRREGREGDAQRYLLQARYLAPPASKRAVAALAAGESNER